MLRAQLVPGHVVPAVEYVAARGLPMRDPRFESARLDDLPYRDGIFDVAIGSDIAGVRDRDPPEEEQAPKIATEPASVTVAGMERSTLPGPSVMTNIWPMPTMTENAAKVIESARSNGDRVIFIRHEMAEAPFFVPGSPGV